MEREDVGMGEVGGDLDLAEEAVGAQREASSGCSTLRATGRCAGVAGEVDRGHAAPAELALEGVAVGESGLEVREEVGQTGAPGDDLGRLARNIRLGSDGGYLD